MTLPRRGAHIPCLPGVTVQRQGFSLLEVAIAVAIVAVLSASIFPVLAERTRYSRVTNAGRVTRELADAITAFREDVAMNPATLRQLTDPITTADVNSCGATYVTADVNKWDGPYYTRFNISSAGFPLSEDQFGHVQNALVRSPASSSPGTTAVQVTGVPEESAGELNYLVDGAAATTTLSRTTGRVRWTTPPEANGFVTVSYHVAVNGC